MARVTTDDKHYKDIADAIRLKGQGGQQYLPEQMANAICEACDAQYVMGIAEGYSMGCEAQHVIETGTFTPETDTSSIHLDIPAGAKLVEIIPQGIPTEVTSISRLPIHYLCACEVFKENNAAYTNQGAIVQYAYGARFATSFYTFDTTNGFSVTCDPGLIFEANMTYQWKAHYWPE